LYKTSKQLQYYSTVWKPQDGERALLPSYKTEM
jgi:hypothetical protein